MLKKLLNKLFEFLCNKKGDTNTIGWIVLVIFIILAVAPQIKTIGNTMVTGATNLNTSLTDTMNN